MDRVTGIRILAAVGVLAIGLRTGGHVVAQSAGPWPAISPLPPFPSPAVQTLPLNPACRENMLRLVDTESTDVAKAVRIRFVEASESQATALQTIALQNTAPQTEPIGPGLAQGNHTDTPQLAPGSGTPPGSYEKISTGWKPIGAVGASIMMPPGELPANLAAPVFARAGVAAAPINESHNWPTLSYSWNASAVGHNPLYFEDVNLERYGYSHGILQPWISGGRFYLNVIFLPYHIVAHPPKEIQYPLGYCRPGDPAPPVLQVEPINIPAGVAEAAFIVGMVIILP
ncbi:MAG TPA: hypothetical protein VHX65_06435 [Pirellulales bacterium]|jgi:hypothetical protein|nr:hypothetical protein [Pirellulales bacterium]